MMKKYKIVSFDSVNDIWILKERFLFFWKTIGCGSKKTLEIFIKENNEKSL